MPNVSLGTIYRNLRILEETGDILELNFGNTVNRFDGRTDDHYHFLCEKCGCIHDVEKCESVDLDSSFARQTGYTIHAHRLEFRGFCRSCASGIS